MVVTSCAVRLTDGVTSGVLVEPGDQVGQAIGLLRRRQVAAREFRDLDRAADSLPSQP
jgi:hypothetical protein